MGTMASTITAFQLKRVMILVICVGKSSPTHGRGDEQQQQEARDDQTRQAEAVQQLSEF